ncbi:MAG: class I SAM-dependent methyltransferase [Pararhodobacter sp.]|nr:class I SAM-dependent methyltransferase [Pararhodobacter sp.]
MSTPHPDPAPRALRLELAFEAGLTLPTDGRIAVLSPRVGESLAPLPRERVQVATPHFPDHAAFTAQGYACARAADPGAAAVMVCLPRARAEALDMLATACALTEGPVIVDGQKTDGVDSLLKTLRSRFAVGEPISKGHGKIFWFPSPGAEAVANWRADPMTVIDAEGRPFQTRAGIFSADAVDQGSALLAGALPATMKGEAVDLGAGWGFLSAALLARAPKITRLHLVESDARALDCARSNVTDPRAVFHWADATLPLPGLQADLVVMNPPFHTGRKGQPGLGIAFIRAAAALLRPAGQLWLVANRHLPYEAAMAASFRSYSEVAGTSAFKVLVGEGPMRRVTARTAPGRERRGGSHARGPRA